MSPLRTTPSSNLAQWITILVAAGTILIASTFQLHAQIEVDRATRALGDNGQVTTIDFSTTNERGEIIRLHRSYMGAICDLKTGQVRSPKDLVFSNQNRSCLIFNIREAIGVFASFAIIKKEGALAEIPNIGDTAYGLYLTRHKGRHDGSTVVTGIKGNLIEFTHLGENGDEPWSHFSARIGPDGTLVVQYSRCAIATSE